MTAKTYYNIKLTRAALALAPSEINPEIIEAARLDSCQIEPVARPPAGLACVVLCTSHKAQKTI